MSHRNPPARHCMWSLNYRVLFVLPCVRLFQTRWHRHDLSSGLGGWLSLSTQKVKAPCHHLLCALASEKSVPGPCTGTAGCDVKGCCATGSERCTVKNPHALPKQQLCTISHGACAWAGVSAVWSQGCDWMPSPGMWPFTDILSLKCCKCFLSIHPFDSILLLSFCQGVIK